MTGEPSIKGSVFIGSAEAVRKLLADGTLTREETERWLEPGDLALIESDRLLVSSWYDIAVFARMAELLRDVEGRGSHEYLRDLGRQTARRLLEGGLYTQLEYLQRTEVANETEPEARFEAFGRDLRLLNTLSSSIYNFGVWSPSPDPERERRYRIRVADAAPLTDPLCWRIDGFINEMAATHDAPDLWTWRRLDADTLMFRMLRDL